MYVIMLAQLETTIEIKRKKKKYHKQIN